MGIDLRTIISQLPPGMLVPQRPGDIPSFVQGTATGRPVTDPNIAPNVRQGPQPDIRSLINALVGGGGAGGGGDPGQRFSSPNPFGTPIRNVEARLRTLAGEPVSTERPPITDFGGQTGGGGQGPDGGFDFKSSPAIANNPFIQMFGLDSGIEPRFPGGNEGLPAGTGFPGGGFNQGGGGQGAAIVNPGNFLSFDPSATPRAGLGKGANLAAFFTNPALASLLAVFGITPQTLAGRSSATSKTTPGSMTFGELMAAQNAARAPSGLDELGMFDFSGLDVGGFGAGGFDVGGLVGGEPGGSSFGF